MQIEANLTVAQILVVAQLLPFTIKYMMVDIENAIIEVENIQEAYHVGVAVGLIFT